MLLVVMVIKYRRVLGRSPCGIHGNATLEWLQKRMLSEIPRKSLGVIPLNVRSGLWDCRILRMNRYDFPGGPVAKTPHSQSRGLWFNLW